jgi:tRNA (cytidine/uridine-2'-O-)-methyltransferase
MVNIVLVEPQIPPNTGNIMRLCAGCDALLHIIRPTGFLLNDKNLKRAGMDYIDSVDMKIWDDLEHFWGEHKINNRHFFASTKNKQNYYDIKYIKNDYIYFGREDAGISEDILNKYPSQNITIPMNDKIRSINLSNSVAIIVYESIRQLGGISEN